MKRLFNFNILFLVSAMVSLFVASCKDDAVELSADRLFRPLVDSTVVSTTWIRMVWQQYKDAKSYEVDLSADTFKTILRSQKTTDPRFTFSQLDFDTKYQIRVRSVGSKLVSSSDTIRSGYTITHVSTLDYPTLLVAPTSADIIDQSVKLKWTSSSLVYTRIDVLTDINTVYKSVDLTNADNAAGEKIVSGLQPNTSYIFKIFSADGYKGKKTAKTAAAQVFEGDVVDLRLFSDEKALSILTQTFVDSLATAHPNGFNLVLSGGATYTLPGIILPVSMNVVTGLSFKGKAVIAVNGNFNVKASTTLASLKFDKIFFTQGNVAGKLKTDANFGGTYLVNMNLADGNIGNLAFSNCDIKYKRGVVRMQASANIAAVTITNCVFDSIGGYGIVNNANDLSSIGDISVKNSSILHSSALFVCGKAKGINSLTLENTTLCFSPNLNSYMFDYTGNAIPGGLTIKNSLFGVGNGATVNGIRSNCSNITITNCYKTSDLQWTMKTDLSGPNAPITDFADLGKTTAQIFSNTSQSNYKVTDAALVNKVGDPRWW